MIEKVCNIVIYLFIDMTLSEDITQLLNITYIYKHINWCQNITMNKQYNRSSCCYGARKETWKYLSIHLHVMQYKVKYGVCVCGWVGGLG